MENNWRLFGEMDLTKSCSGQESDNDFWFIQGMILTDLKDTVGETPILKSMDWSYFDTNGIVKYEHDPDGKPSPVNVIGVPHLRKSLPHGEWLRARLLPRDEKSFKKGLTKDYARETAELIKAIQEHNNQFPDNKRTLGFSVEGKYLGKLDKGQYWGKVINVVVTPNPVGTNTYSEMAKSHNNDLVKALATGYATSPETQTGGAALREESLKGVPKKDGSGKGVRANKGRGGCDIIEEVGKGQLENKLQVVNNNKRGKTMKFKDVDEAKDYYMGEEGLDEDAALKKAKTHFPDEEELQVEDETKKSLNDNIVSLKKSISKFTDFFKKAEDPSATVEPVEPVAGEEVPDITPHFEMLTKSVMELTNHQDETNVELAKSLTHFADSFEALVKSIQADNEEIKKSIAEQDKLLKALGKRGTDVSFLNLDGEKLIEGDKNKLSKAQVLNTLSELVKAGKVTPLEITKFELSGQLPSQIAAFPEFN